MSFFGAFMKSLVNRSVRCSFSRRIHRRTPQDDSTPAFSVKLLFDQHNKPQREGLGNHRMHASDVFKSAAASAKPFLAPHSEMQWGQILEQARTASVHKLAHLLRSLASLDQEFFDKASLLSLKGGEGDKSILKELHEIFTELLQSSQFSDFSFNANELFVFGDVFTKMNLDHDPLLDWVLSSLAPYLPSFSDQELIAVSFLAHANDQMPEETSSAIEVEIQNRSYQLDPEQLALLIGAFNACRRCFETSLTDEIVADKTALWIKSWTPRSNGETFQALLQNLALNGQPMTKRNYHLIFARQILSAFNETFWWDESTVPFFIWTAFMDYFRVVGWRNPAFRNRAVQGFYSSYSSDRLCRLKLRQLSDFMSAFTNYSSKVPGAHEDFFEMVEGEIRRRLVAGQLEETPRSDSDLLIILCSLAVNERLPEDLLLHVLDENFSSISMEKRSLSGRPQSNLLLWTLHFLDSCVQFHPQLRSRLPRCPDVVLEAIRKDDAERTKKGVRSVAVNDMSNTLGSMLDMGGHMVCKGRLLPHFVTEDIVVQYGLDGFPIAFDLDSNMRLLDVDSLRLPPGRKGLVIIIKKAVDHVKPLDLKRKQLQFLGYNVKLVDIEFWRNMTVRRRRDFLQEILRRYNVATL